jgi:hypothetical protein
VSFSLQGNDRGKKYNEATHRNKNLLPLSIFMLYFTSVIHLSWLTHCPTSRKVACSIPDGVTGIFHLYNPSSLTMALGLTQPLTEMSTNTWGLKVASA